MKWSFEDIEYLKNNYTNLGSKKCSLFLKRTQNATRKKAYMLGLKSFKFNKPIYIIKIICDSCGKKFEQKTKRNKEDYIKKYCSISCSNKRKHTKETKNKIKNGVDKYYIKNNKNKKKTTHRCNWCNENFMAFKSKKRKFCGTKCSGKYGASKVRNHNYVKRSKNEIYFYELCKQKFENVDHNKQIFNNWDADVIIHDLKIAVLWNGKWHYEKITEKHSLKQVQNRDRIKIKEIKKYGYDPYIIKDMGSHNKKYVEKKF